MTRAAAKPKPKAVRVALREDVARGMLPLASGQARVDRERGIIFGVKVVGSSSPNTHGVRGAEGTDYTPEALAGALALYEGLKVNVDHPPRQKPGEERSALDRLGKLVNARMHAGETYADLHLLKSHPMAGRLMEAAERMPDAFALSHNAVGQGEVRNGRYVVTAIPEVRSVDVVADGGTNASLFESKRHTVKITVKKLLETKVLAALDKGRQKRLGKLLEADTAGLGAEADMREDDAADHRDHLYAAHKACVTEGDDETADKILGLMKSKKPEAKDTEEGEEDDDEKKDTEEGEEDDKDASKAKAQEESRKRRCARLAKGYLNLRENEQPAKALVDALAKLPDEDSRLSLLESWPRGAAAAPGKGGSPPRSAAPGRPLQESAAAKSADDLATILLR